MTEPKSLCVHVIDDDDSARRSLCTLLRAHGYVPFGHVSAEAFLADLKLGEAACVLLDLRMSGMSGLELQRVLNERGAHLPVIVITAHGDVPAAVRAIKNGAIDFIEKPIPEDQLLGALTAAQELVTHRHLSPVPADTVATRLARLTAREREVLDLLVQGWLSKEIAVELAISVRTVEVHRARIKEKMEARGIADLVRMLN